MRQFWISRRAILQSLAVIIISPINSLRADGAVIPVKLTLLDKTTSSITFTATSTATGMLYLEYGFQKNSLQYKSEILSITPKVTRKIEIKDLKPDSVIYYRLKYMVGKSKSFLATAISNVSTSKVLSTNTFAIQADPHMDENSSEQVYVGTLKQIAAASPAFLMDLGDIFMVDKLQDKSEKNIRGRFELMKNYYQNLGEVPLKITLGNHDGELGYSKFNTKNFRREYFPEQTGDLAYFSFEGPDQLHVVLDPFTYTTENPKDDGWQWTLGKTQYDWLKATLSASSATHKFIYIHHLLVGNAQSRGGVEIAHLNEWGGKNNDGSYGFDEKRPGWGKPIHQILLDNKVSHVFKGHDHLYVKQELDGIIYQTLPQPSHPGDKLDVKQYGYLSGKGVGGSGFLKVTTVDKEAKVDFIKWDGSVADSYTRSAT